MSVIICDMDGVLSDFNTGFSYLLRPHKVPYLEDFFPHCWEWPQYYGVPQEVIEKAWNEVRLCGTFWRSLPPYPTAWEDIRSLQRLATQGHWVYFVTTRIGKTAKQETEGWLWQHGMDGATVIVTDKKHLVSEAVKADLIVDDKPSNLLGHPTGCRLALMRRPYNIQEQGQFHSVSTVREALALVGL